MRSLGWIASDQRAITVMDAGALRERCGMNGGSPAR
jgi:hypothetical protein